MRIAVNIQNSRNVRIGSVKSRGVDETVRVAGSENVSVGVVDEASVAEPRRSRSTGAIASALKNGASAVALVKAGMDVFKSAREFG